jgi:hypothetical protein
MIKKLALLFGVVFVLIGLLGFIPALAPKDSTGMPELLGLFMVGTIHNIIHLASGVAALYGASKGEKYALLYFKVFGVVYALVTIIGFIQKNTVLGIIHVNLADNLLHLVLALAIGGIGFGLGGLSSKKRV